MRWKCKSLNNMMNGVQLGYVCLAPNQHLGGQDVLNLIGLAFHISRSMRARGLFVLPLNVASLLIHGNRKVYSSHTILLSVSATDPTKLQNAAKNNAEYARKTPCLLDLTILYVNAP